MTYGQYCDWMIIAWDVFADISIFHQLQQFCFQSFLPLLGLSFRWENLVLYVSGQRVNGNLNL